MDDLEKRWYSMQLKCTLDIYVDEFVLAISGTGIQEVATSAIKESKMLENAITEGLGARISEAKAQ
eukprot:1111983-Lingulodinium_polyedra.AAC.1